MAGEYDSTEFIDSDFTTQTSPFAASTSGATPLRAPSRDDVDRKVVEAQQKLVELKRAQEELERERAGLEELRRRQSEFQTGRQEIIQQLTRGLGLLEEAEFCARRDAEQPGAEVPAPPHWRTAAAMPVSFLCPRQSNRPGPDTHCACRSEEHTSELQSRQYL